MSNRKTRKIVAKFLRNHFLSEPVFGEDSESEVLDQANLRFPLLHFGAVRACLTHSLRPPSQIQDLSMFWAIFFLSTLSLSRFTFSRLRSSASSKTMVCDWPDGSRSHPVKVSREVSRAVRIAHWHRIGVLWTDVLSSFCPLC